MLSSSSAKLDTPVSALKKTTVSSSYFVRASEPPIKSSAPQILGSDDPPRPEDALMQ